MKIKSIILIITILLLSSCGVNNGGMGMANLTQVNLSDNNFKIVKNVSGEASSIWVLYFGPFSDTALVASAKENMLENANLSGSQALANMTWDVTIQTIFGLITTKTVYMTADVVEFK